MKLYAPWEKTFNRVYTPFEHFLHAQTTTGIILMSMTIIALLLANSPFGEFYSHLFHTKIAFSFGESTISYSMHHWINDGLMAIFFFIVGLEIKREILVGELSDIKVAILPILAALGGMVLPALIYLSINYNTESAMGWGIPMATDIAFAISALVLLGNRVSPALVTFLVALAIVDDLGAVLVIAIFYTSDIHLLQLFLSFAVFLVMVSFNRFGIQNSLSYAILGIIMWLFMLDSGIHATIAGVIAAMAIPSKPKETPISFSQHTKNLLLEYDSYPITTDHIMHEKQKAILQSIKDRIDAISPHSSRIEHSLHLPVSLLIIPLFALANAGIRIDFSSIGEAIFSNVSLGIMSGLILGKVLGIAGTAYLAIKIGIAKLPLGSTMSQIFGVAFLGGIGFTMSIFVADLAFIGNEEMIFQAKVGILIASLFAGTFGYLWLRFTKKQLYIVLQVPCNTIDLRE
jgi:NhaA family Na+:H+ antiporter